MISLRLDNMLYPISTMVYPGGEVSISQYIPYLQDHIEVVACIEKSDDFFALALLKNILDRDHTDIDLELSYVPYARQDRFIENSAGNQALSIKVFADMLNALKFNKVTIVDPHSTVTPALINNCVVKSRLKCVELYLETIRNLSGDNMVLVAPDVGAIKSVEEIASRMKLPWTFAIKKRDPVTGYLKIVDIPNIEILDGSHMIVLDDIADGSMTFNLLVEYIKQRTDAIPLSKTLYVTHGIFSKGLDELLTNYDTVATYNLFDKYYGLRKDVNSTKTNSLTIFNR